MGLICRTVGQCGVGRSGHCRSVGGVVGRWGRSVGLSVGQLAVAGRRLGLWSSPTVVGRWAGIVLGLSVSRSGWGEGGERSAGATD